ncbi:hypothetical protein ACFYMO_03640 [Streptomyces sp. NPDC007025]|uniref:hypothetical protein n=1 Tax=Streptomyces sp. NPDC007025 TaxID=3364771 RepID=UPI00368AE9F0
MSAPKLSAGWNKVSLREGGEMAAEVLREAAAEVVAFCPEHGDRDTVRMACHCELADELRRNAAEVGETAGGTCGAKLTPRSGTRPCVLPAGHPGHHQDQHTNTWPNSGGAS